MVLVLVRVLVPGVVVPAGVPRLIAIRCWQCANDREADDLHNQEGHRQSADVILGLCRRLLEHFIPLVARPVDAAEPLPGYAGDPEEQEEEKLIDKDGQGGGGWRLGEASHMHQVTSHVDSGEAGHVSEDRRVGLHQALSLLEGLRSFSDKQVDASDLRNALISLPPDLLIRHIHLFAEIAHERVRKNPNLFFEIGRLGLAISARGDCDDELQHRKKRQKQEVAYKQGGDAGFLRDCRHDELLDGPE
mmetsp:Transcript_38154/g.109700  ORF Transcript_38154/g.109700 Transcript_38154/m.109700 type:complete len:247 (+) Transcript_38154:772-1512(+)